MSLDWRIVERWRCVWNDKVLIMFIVDLTESEEAGVGGELTAGVAASTRKCNPSDEPDPV